MQTDDHVVQCWHCLADFDVSASVWCSCSPTHPTKLCPFCLACFCTADPAYAEALWRQAPESMVQERETLQTRRMLLGDMLVAGGLLTTDQLITALKRQAETGEKLGECLLHLGFIEASVLRNFLGEQHAPVTFDLADRIIKGSLAQKVGVEFCVEHRVLPLEMETFQARRMVIVAMADPANSHSIEQVQERLGAQVIAGFSPEREILGALRDIFPTRVGNAEQADDGDVLAMQLLRRAWRCRASHLHLEVTPSISRVSCRVDGVLYRLRSLSGSVDTRHVDAVLAWFGPGGRSLTIDGRTQELHLEASRTPAATSLTVRFREADEVNTTLGAHSIDPEGRTMLNRALAAPAGLIVLSGPAHGGAESSFWGLVNLAGGQGRPVDVHGAPLDHPAPQVRSASAGSGGGAGIAFHHLPAPASWAVLVEAARHQLVVLLLDRRRADAALQDLLRQGVPAAQLETSLLALLTHCSVRRICDRCFKPAGLAPSTLMRFGLTAAEAADLHTFHGAGCEACGISPGYRGQQHLLETVAWPSGAPLTQAERGAPLIARARRQLRRACLDLIHRGLTTVDEMQKLRLPGPSAAD